MDVGRAEGKGVFVLVRTSNPSAAQVQDFADADGKKFYEHMAELVAALRRRRGLVGRAATAASARWSGRPGPTRPAGCAN